MRASTLRHWPVRQDSTKEEVLTERFGPHSNAYQMLCLRRGSQGERPLRLTLPLARKNRSPQVTMARLEAQHRRSIDCRPAWLPTNLRPSSFSATEATRSLQKQGSLVRHSDVTKASELRLGAYPTKNGIYLIDLGRVQEKNRRFIPAGGAQWKANKLSMSKILNASSRKTRNSISQSATRRRKDVRTES